MMSPDGSACSRPIAANVIAAFREDGTTRRATGYDLL